MHNIIYIKLRKLLYIENRIRKMKKVLIVSATLKNNYKFAKNVESLLNGLDVQSTLI